MSNSTVLPNGKRVYEGDTILLKDIEELKEKREIQGKVTSTRGSGPSAEIELSVKEGRVLSFTGSRFSTYFDTKKIEVLD